MGYPSYLVHYNKNHSKKNGQFISGDGDGDGTVDEHHRYTTTTKFDRKFKKGDRSGISRETSHVIKSTNKVGNSILDKKNKKSTHDNDDDLKQVQKAAQEAARAYFKTGNPDEVGKILSSKLKNIPYRAIIDTRTWSDGYKYGDMLLTVYGNKQVYDLMGSSNNKDDWKDSNFGIGYIKKRNESYDDALN